MKIKLSLTLCCSQRSSKMADKSEFSSVDQEDDLLKRAMHTYVQQGLKREEVIDFLSRRLSSIRMEYQERLSTDVCNISEFGSYNDNTVSTNLKMIDYWQTVKKRMWRAQVKTNLGYRASWHGKTSPLVKYDILVTRDEGCTMSMYDASIPKPTWKLGGDALDTTRTIRRKKGNFSSERVQTGSIPWWTW